ncbi:hypothetical protein KI387_013509, partial [Taxus chinensis]
MTVTPNITIEEGNLVVNGKTILTGVPDNVILTPGSGVGLVQGAFIGVTSMESKSHHAFPIGVLDGLRFMCLFRFKLWWMTQRMGRCGKDVPLETQFMLVESKHGSPLSSENDLSEEEQTIYTVFLPLIEGQFRAVLQGNERDEIEVCLESVKITAEYNFAGDASVKTNQGLYAVYMHAGLDPFEVISDAVRAVERHLQTFQHREKKKCPAFVDWFGWCTWDAFYTDVTAEGVDEGLKSLSQGGTPPRFLIIDDGWQQIDSEVEDDKATVQEGAQFASRLTGIKENQKFQKHRKGTEITKDPPGLRHVVEEAKEHHNVNLLKIWNLNKFTGMLGAFNCQGAGWCKVVKKNRIHDTSPAALSGSVRSRDVDLLPQIAGDDWSGDSVFYGHRSGELIRVPKGAAIPITLEVLEFELYTVSPIK